MQGAVPGKVSNSLCDLSHLIPLGFDDGYLYSTEEETDVQSC